MENKITVIMSVYNCRETLHKSIGSLLAQTYKQWQAVICDDCSADGSADILAAYQKEYPQKFKIITNPKNMGLAYSLNRCMQLVNTEYTARMDGDDTCSIYRFEKELEFLQNNNRYSLVSCTMEVFDGERVTGVVERVSEPKISDAVKHSCFAHAAVLMRTDVLRALGGYNCSNEALRIEDYELWCRFIAAGYKGYNMREPLYTALEDKSTYLRRDNGANIRWAKLCAGYIKKFGLPPYYYLFAARRILMCAVPVPVYTAIHNFKIKSGMHKKRKYK